MVKIVTGKINSLKTSRALDDYQTNQKGDGFLSIKNMDQQKVLSYDALRLKTNEKRRLASHKENNPYTFKNQLTFGPYVFNLDTFDWMNHEISHMISQQVHPIYMDEIGNLELKGFGYDAIIKKCLESNMDLVIVVREDLLDQVIKHYQIKDFIIIT